MCLLRSLWTTLTPRSLPQRNTFLASHHFTRYSRAFATSSKLNAKETRIDDPNSQEGAESAIDFTRNASRSKVTIDALLESISTPKLGPGRLSLASNSTKDSLEEFPQDNAAFNEYDGFDGAFINLDNVQQSWKSQRNTNTGSYILRMTNCGNTMIKSDIERLFSNHDARLKGWHQEGMDIIHIVPARDRILQRLNHYYIYFRSEKAAKNHLENFVGFRKPDEKIDWNLVTLPPPAAAQTARESIRGPSSNVKGGPMSMQKWVTSLFPENGKRISLAGVTPSILNRREGAPGRTVLVCLCANHHWQYLQIWLRYSILEKHGFGKWLVTGGDSEGFGLERVTIPRRREPLHGGRWLIRFRNGSESEAARLVRDWDRKWVRVRGNSGIMTAELLW
ncbi:hypothetical protein TWF694_000177 [Orbilia ellipsospora]|uniref:Uncharacterized protein n=1 Tax=Orbilia ellipsospora TaxID=2528407 RepID=A0AAV9XMT9_9PEZI